MSESIEKLMNQLDDPDFIGSFNEEEMCIKMREKDCLMKNLY